ncbi:MAG: hypothetical protein IT581_15235 [Verrucomicrobiales bacterium]|nr:hypothetical protein [Verrucomicrobiales bacterium]
MPGIFGRSRWRSFGVALLAVWAMAQAPKVSAQIQTVVFQDDFSANTIDPAKYQADAPFFEGGVGDIHAEAKSGTIEFVGKTTQQWWSGGTLQVMQTFTASESSPVTVSIDRVAEAGVGTASRSALWILDETKTKYVLFADVRAEGGWRFNRKIGEDGDAPTGSGTDIALFNGGNYDDGALHRMSIVADGKTVKLLLDGVQGTEVKFPFSKVIFEFGSYARANDDTAATTWDNLKIEVAKPTSVVFSDDFSSNAINPGKFQADAPFFEGGTGDIHATAHDGVLEFVGTTTQQWWSGATLRVVPTFTATEETPVQISIDRVAEAGVGTASRSALWILDETQTKYVLFADVRAEGGWRFNRKIGEDGDVPTGSGTDIALFNGGNYDDGAFHKMGILADGKTVKLMLDGQVGAEVKFPFSKVIFHFGSYARANSDTASTTWDNVKVEAVVRQSSVVFTDDFAANSIDPAKYKPDAPFFEGGVGDIHAEARNGTIEFVGKTTQQWWSGSTLELVPRFAPSEQEVITLAIDRVAEAGVGTASRSALWILDETKTRYVLFADVRAEGGWRFNRKIGEDGDVPTGSGTDIAAFNGGNYDDGALHRMSLIADGKTVKLLLDGLQGAEVKFPFSPVIFEFGAYARANDDTAATTWDNLTIETAGSAAFSPASVSVRNGQVSGEVTVRLPSGLNAQNAVQVRVASSNPSVAVPEGGTGGALTLNFPAGGANTATFRVRGLSFGGTTFNIESGANAANQLSVAVISGPAVLLEDSFASATLDSAKWEVSNRGFETTGTGTFTVAQNGGNLVISGAPDTDFWPGASVVSKGAYVATKELNLVVELDRVSVDGGGGTGARTGVYLTTADHSKFVYFHQNFGTSGNGWAVNVNPGTVTGDGAAIALFNGTADDTGLHRLKLVADGSTVEVFRDGVSGGKFEFAVSSGIHVEIGAYARAAGDIVEGRFDNLKVENTLPCSTFSEANVSMTVADSSKSVSVTIPALLHDAAAATVTVTSRNPAVAVPAGAVNGVLTLTYAAGASDSQTIQVSPVGLGSTTFEIATTPASCVTRALNVEVVAVPEVLLTDDFSGASIDTAKWTQDSTPFDPSGTATAESGISLDAGRVKIDVTAETSLWPGFALFTAKTYTAGATTPVTFEVDRTLLQFVLTTGTGAEQRTGAWIREPGGNFVFLNDYVAHDGRNFGWRYNKQTGQADDNPTGDGINVVAFDGGNFDDRAKHRIKIVANGATVKLYVDGVFGVEVAFPFSQGLSFGFGAYADEATNATRGFFDNVTLTGGSAPVQVRPTLTATRQGANLVVSWTGTGTLQEADAVGNASAWRDVSPAPTGNTYTTTTSAAAKFYRVRQ